MSPGIDPMVFKGIFIAGAVGTCRLKVVERSTSRSDRKILTRSYAGGAFEDSGGLRILR